MTMPQPPLPSAEIYNRYPEIGIAILVIIVLGAIIYGLFVAYSSSRDKQEKKWLELIERREKSWQAGQSERDRMMREFWAGQNNAILQAVQKLADKLNEHDEETKQAINIMMERTKLYGFGEQGEDEEQQTGPRISRPVSRPRKKPDEPT